MSGRIGAATSDHELAFGQRAVELGLISSKDLSSTLIELRNRLRAGDNMQLIQILLIRGLLGPHEIAQVATSLQQGPVAGNESVCISLGVDPDVRLGDTAEGSQTTPSAEAIHPRYQVLGKLGSGGMARVYLAIDKELKRKVALKVISCRDESDRVKSRFLAEAQTTAQLSHPNIVPLYDIGTLEDGNFYVTMKAVRGRTLEEEIARYHRDRSPQQRNRLLRCLTDVADGLAYAHNKGVIHRDLKPANIMVAAYGETLVMDWGIARIQSQADLDVDAIPESDAGATLSLSWWTKSAMAVGKAFETAHGALVGTVHYMSPEQAAGRNDEIDLTTDVWALGVILYEILTGDLPFLAATKVDLLDLIWHSDPPHPSKIDRSIPRELSSIALKCLAKRRQDRYQKCEEIKDDLAAFLEGHAVSSVHYSPWQRALLWIRRNRVSAGIGLLLALIPLVATATLIGGAGGGAIDAAEAADLERRLEERVESDRRIGEATELLVTADAILLHPDASHEAIDPVLGRARSILEPTLDDEAAPAVAHVLAGRVAELRGDLDGAEAAYRRAIAIDSDLSSAHYRLGTLLLLRAQLADPNVSGGGDAPTAWCEQAIESFEAARLRSTADPVRATTATEFARGYLARLQGNSPSALGAARRGIRDHASEPGVEWFHWLRGVASGQERESEDAFATILKTRPNDLPTLLARAAGRLRSGDHEAAQQDLTRALRVHPWSIDASFLRGRTLAAKGARSQAIADYGRVLGLAPDHLGALVERAICRREQGSLEDALGDLERALTRAPDHAPALLQRAMILRLRGENESAKADLDRAIGRADSDPDLYLERGRVHEAIGDLDAAIADWQRALVVAGTDWTERDRCLEFLEQVRRRRGR